MSEQESSQERLRKQMDFIREIDREKEVSRQTYLADGSRKEDDAEHAWHLAVMAFLLAEYANEDIDVFKTVKIVLIHDLVEIYAGDTYAYDTEGAKTQRSREVAAANKLFSLLPQDQEQELRRLWEEFEEAVTPEAKFARTLDKFQPVVLNDASNGISWKEHGVYEQQILKRNEKTHEGSETIWAYEKSLIDKNVKNGNIKDGNIR